MYAFGKKSFDAFWISRKKYVKLHEQVYNLYNLQ